MTTMRKRHSAAFKAKIVQELLKEEKPLTQLAAEHGVHPNQLREWKRIALTGLTESSGDALLLAELHLPTWFG